MADNDRTIEIRITAKNMSDAELAKARQAIAGFKRDADAASSSTSGFGGALRNASSLAGVFGVTLGVGAVVKFGQALLDDADALVKLADKTGMSTDAVQRLKYIAEQSGNTLENLTGAVSQLQRRLGQGDDSAVAAIRSLGLEVDRFQQMDPDAQFMAIAREVAKIEDPMQRAAKATELFGRSGTEILPSLIAKVDELAEKAPVMSAKAVQAFDAIGDGLSDLWARTKNAVGEGLATMFDSYGRLASGMKALFSGDVSGALAIFTDLAEQELPKVANAANLVHPPLTAIALSTKDVEAIETKLDGTRKRSIDTAKRYASEQEKIAAAMERIGLTTPAAVTQELALYQALLKQLPTVVAVNDAQIAYLPTLEKLAAAAERAGLKVPTLTAALEAARTVAAHAGDGFVAWEQALPLVPLDQLIDLTGTQTEQLDAQAVQARLLTDAYHDFGLQTPAELRAVADAAARQYQLLRDSGTASFGQLQTAYAQMITSQRAVTGEIPKQWSLSVVPGIRQSLGQLQTAVSGTFAQMMLGAKGFKDGFVDIWSSLKASVVRIFAEIADTFVSSLLKRMLAALAGNKQAFSGGFASLFTGATGGVQGGMGSAAMPSASALLGVGARALPGASGSVIGPEMGTGQMLMSGSGGGTDWGQVAGGGMMAVGGAVGLYQSLQSGSKIGATLSGAATGAGIGTMIAPGIGTAIGAGAGAVGGFLASLFGGNKEAKQVNDLRDAFVAAAGGIDQLNRKAQEAGTTLDALLKAKTVKDYEAAIASLNTKLENTAKLQGELAGLQQQLAGRQEMNWAVGEELITKYGGTLGNLGKQFVAAKQQASFKEVWDDWQTLIDMGADVGGVLVSMKDEIGALVGESMRIGTEIPAQFKPLIEELIRTGQLFDDNGEAITDISKLKFGAPLVSEVDKIVTKIGELIELLTKGVTGAFESVGRTRVPSVKIPYHYEAENEPPDGADVPTPAYASGALITRPHVAMVGEGGEPELIGPVGFMREAIAGALQSFAPPRGDGGIVTGVLQQLTAALRDLAQRADAPATAPLAITIQAMDPIGLKTVVEQEVGPMLVSAYRRNVNGMRTATRKELVE